MLAKWDLVRASHVARTLRLKRCISFRRRYVKEIGNVDRGRFWHCANINRLKCKLREIEDILGQMPPLDKIREPDLENLAWWGRASAFMSRWNPNTAARFRDAIDASDIIHGKHGEPAMRKAVVMLNEVRYNLRLEALGPLSSHAAQGMHFDYFDTIRRIVEEACDDLLFIDPYLDADFVSKFLPLASPGIGIRLLTTNKRLSTLLPAVDAFAAQNKTGVGVREDPQLHDRHLLVDGRARYQSGASFKDGPRNADTTVSQIIDLFPEVRAAYESRWAQAYRHR